MMCVPNPEGFTFDASGTPDPHICYAPLADIMPAALAQPGNAILPMDQNKLVKICIHKQLSKQGTKVGVPMEAPPKKNATNGVRAFWFALILVPSCPQIIESGTHRGPMCSKGLEISYPCGCLPIDTQKLALPPRPHGQPPLGSGVTRALPVTWVANNLSCWPKQKVAVLQPKRPTVSSLQA